MMIGMKRAFSLLAVISGLSFFSAASAKAETRPVTSRCLIHAVKAHGLYLGPVLGLIATEGGHPGTVRLNTNGSHDLGVMQINDSAWLRKIADLGYHGDIEAARASLRDDGCANVWFATGIFASYVNEARGDYALAVGWYNSHTVGYMRAYQKNFVRRYMMVMEALSRHGLLQRMIADASEHDNEGEGPTSKAPAAISSLDVKNRASSGSENVRDEPFLPSEGPSEENSTKSSSVDHGKTPSSMYLSFSN